MPMPYRTYSFSRILEAQRYTIPTNQPTKQCSTYHIIIYIIAPRLLTQSSNLIPQSPIHPPSRHKHLTPPSLLQSTSIHDLPNPQNNHLSTEQSWGICTTSNNPTPSVTYLIHHSTTSSRSTQIPNELVHYHVITPSPSQTPHLTSTTSLLPSSQSTQPNKVLTVSNQHPHASL